MYVNITWYEYTSTWMCEGSTCLPAVKVALKSIVYSQYCGLFKSCTFFRVCEKHYMMWRCSGAAKMSYECTGRWRILTVGCENYRRCLTREVSSACRPFWNNENLNTGESVILVMVSAGNVTAFGDETWLPCILSRYAYRPFARRVKVKWSLWTPWRHVAEWRL